MYRIKRDAIIKPGTTPANQSLLTGCLAIIPYKTKTTLGGIKIPKELPAWTTPVIILLS